MSNIPFEDQLLPPDPLDQIAHKIGKGEAVSGDELLEAIEQRQGHSLDDRTRAVVRRFSVSAVKRRGRPSNCKGRQDFALEEVDARYPSLLRKHEEEAQRRRIWAAANGVVLASAERTPSELAYTEILREMKADFPNLDWTALRNQHSAWNNGHLHPTENDTDSEDVAAAIERLYPQFKKIIKNGGFCND